jgi:hypothetical protein
VIQSKITVISNMQLHHHAFMQGSTEEYLFWLISCCVTVTAIAGLAYMCLRKLLHALYHDFLRCSNDNIRAALQAAALGARDMLGPLSMRERRRLLVELRNLREAKSASGEAYMLAVLNSYRTLLEFYVKELQDFACLDRALPRVARILTGNDADVPKLVTLPGYSEEDLGLDEEPIVVTTAKGCIRPMEPESVNITDDEEQDSAITTDDDSADSDATVVHDPDYVPGDGEELSENELRRQRITIICEEECSSETDTSDESEDEEQDRRRPRGDAVDAKRNRGRYNLRSAADKQRNTWFLTP